jgi:hypothetical protein
MALTRDFKETIQARVERDPVFRAELLKEGVECLLSGDRGRYRAGRLCVHAAVHRRGDARRGRVVWRSTCVNIKVKWVRICGAHVNGRPNQ